MFSLPMTGWKAIEDRKEKVAMIELAYHTQHPSSFDCVRPSLNFSVA